MLEYVLTDEGSDIIKNDICKRLEEGQVGILPTDTVYGLVCLAGRDDARQRICEMKARDGNKPMQYLVADLDNCSWLGVEISENLRKLSEAFWPGPLTVVATNGDGDYVGIRVPKNDFICSIVSAIGKPLTATSANLSGSDPEESLRNHFKDLNGEPDFALLGDPINQPSSTVIRLHTDGKVDMLREGVIKQKDIDKVLND